MRSAILGVAIGLVGLGVVIPVLHGIRSIRTNTPTNLPTPAPKTIPCLSATVRNGATGETQTVAMQGDCTTTHNNQARKA